MYTCSWMTDSDERSWRNWMFFSVLVWGNRIFWFSQWQEDVWDYVYIYSLTPPQTQSPERSSADDFLDSLLGGSDSSRPASPLWSPCTTDSGINEDPLMDHTESPHQNFYATAIPQDPGHQLPAGEKTASIDQSKTGLTVTVIFWYFGPARNISEAYSHMKHYSVETHKPTGTMWSRALQHCQV